MLQNRDLLKMQINAKSILNVVLNKSSHTESALHAEVLSAEFAALVSGGATDEGVSTQSIGGTTGPDWGDWIKR